MVCLTQTCWLIANTFASLRFLLRSIRHALRWWVWRVYRSEVAVIASNCSVWFGGWSCTQDDDITNQHGSMCRFCFHVWLIYVDIFLPVAKEPSGGAEFYGSRTNSARSQYRKNWKCSFYKVSLSRRPWEGCETVGPVRVVKEPRRRS